jgi:hypothetical protein
MTWRAVSGGPYFPGRWTPESVGDYASGTNHVLPTYGYSRMYSGVSLDSFIKYMTAGFDSPVHTLVILPYRHVYVWPINGAVRGNTVHEYHHVIDSPLHALVR